MAECSALGSVLSRDTKKYQKLTQNVLVSYTPSSSKYVIQVLVGDYVKEV